LPKSHLAKYSLDYFIKVAGLARKQKTLKKEVHFVKEKNGVI
jgi:hypothetical protein